MPPPIYLGGFFSDKAKNEMQVYARKSRKKHFTFIQNLYIYYIRNGMAITIEKRNELRRKLEKAYKIIHKDNPVKKAEFGDTSRAPINPFTNNLSTLLINRFEEEKKDDNDKLGFSSDTIWRLFFDDDYLTFNSKTVNRIEGFCDEIIKNASNEQLQELELKQEKHKVENVYIEADTVTVNSKNTFINNIKKGAGTIASIGLILLLFWINPFENCCTNKTNIIEQAVKDLKRKEAFNITKDYINNVLYTLEDSNCSNDCNEIDKLESLHNELLIFLSKRNTIEEENAINEGNNYSSSSKENIAIQIATCNLIIHICDLTNCTESTLKSIHKIKTNLKSHY